MNSSSVDAKILIIKLVPMISTQWAPVIINSDRGI